MKPPPFRYEAPESEEQLFAILAEYGDEARMIAGGQSLVPLMNSRLAAPAVLVDLNRLPDLRYIESEADGIRLGALTRHAQVEDSTLIAGSCALLSDAVSQLAHRAVRNRGTLGGSLALGYPGAELPAALVTLEADIRIRSAKGDRVVAASDMFLGPMETDLEPDEMVESAVFGMPPADAGQAFVEVARRHGDFAIAAAAAIVSLDGEGKIARARVGVTGGIAVPQRLEAAESSLVGEMPGEALWRETARAACVDLEIMVDPEYPVNYRRSVLEATLQRALATASGRAGHVH